MSSPYLVANSVTVEGLASITKRNWPKLQQLDLSSNKFGDEGIPYLKAFPNLKKLYLGGCGISTKGLQLLSELEFPNLAYLGLGKIVDN